MQKVCIKLLKYEKYVYMYVYIYIYMNHFSVQQKLKQFCKSTILQYQLVWRHFYKLGLVSLFLSSWEKCITETNLDYSRMNSYHTELYLLNKPLKPVTPWDVLIQYEVCKPCIKPAECTKFGNSNCNGANYPMTSPQLVIQHQLETIYNQMNVDRNNYSLPFFPFRWRRYLRWCLGPFQGVTQFPGYLPCTQEVHMLVNLFVQLYEGS